VGVCRGLWVGAHRGSWVVVMGTRRGDCGGGRLLYD
jgi:hypothetical protein